MITAMVQHAGERIFLRAMQDQVEGAMTISWARIAPMAAMLMGLAAAPNAAAETFKYGSFVPERSTANQKGVFPLMDKIDKLTEGRVKFERLVGGTVLTAPNSLRGIRDRVVDAGFVVVQFHATDIPYASLMAELTGFGTDTFATLGALNEAYFVTCRECREDFKKHGLVPLVVQSATPLTMVCTKKTEGAADLKGLRLSATGTPEMRWGTALGMTPKRQTFSEFVQALQLGQSDCVAAPIAWIKSYGLVDVTKSVIEMPQGVITGAVPILMNAAALAKISDADKKAIARAIPRWIYDYVDAAYVEADVEVKKELQPRVAFVPGDKALADKWAQHQPAEAAALVELAERRKLANAKQLGTDFAAVFKKWHSEHLPKFKGKPDVFAEILWSEVFSKVTY
jgi:TRAP-type C4-dicarboxylate transport system substrate-binding protein